MSDNPFDSSHAPRMPVLFVGHGSPMNAIEDNLFTRQWRVEGEGLPRPQAILCVSAHWETWGAAVTAVAQPRTIHDFGGFPPELFAVQYPAPGSRVLAEMVQTLLQPGKTALDEEWGLDHGAWSVLKPMFPAADIPVVQLSLDDTLTPLAHYQLAKRLLPLRQMGVLVMGSGNMVHNLRRVVLHGRGFEDFNQPFGLEWAVAANDLMKQLIDEERFEELADYPRLGAAVALAVPTPEHFLPLLYALALKQPGETVRYFNDVPVGGSLTMTSLRIG